MNAGELECHIDSFVSDFFFFTFILLQADYDFSCGVQLAVETGRPLAVCPGTAAWSSLSGCVVASFCILSFR